MPDQDFVKVVGRFGITVGDGPSDPDEYPDVIWCDEGFVRLTPVNTYTKVAGGSPSPWTGGQAAIDVPLNHEGFLSWSGQPHVYVTDLTSAKVNPQVPSGKATHRVQFMGVKAQGTPVAFPETTVRLAADAVDPVTGAVDLTLAMPVPTAGGTPIVVGPRGAGIKDAKIEGGALILELDDTAGTEIDAGPLPVGPGGSDAGVAGYIASPSSATSAALSAKIAEALAGDELVVEAAADAVDTALAAGGVSAARGNLASGTDLDTLTAVSNFGIWQLTSAGTYANRPTGTSGVAVLEITGSANIVMQRLTHTGVSYDWVRNKLSAGAWSAWVPTIASRGALATGTNVSTLTAVSNAGLYRLPSSNSYTGIPSPVAGVEATLEVLSISGTITQSITTASGLWRRFYRDATFSPWRFYGEATVFVGPNDPEPYVRSGAEYVWFKTDGNGGHLDTLTGKKD